MTARPETPLLLPSLRGLAWSRLPSEAMAALTLAAVAIPEQIATAHLAGLPAGSGLVAFAAGTLAFALMGRSPHLSVGADSTVAVVFAAALAAQAGGAQAGDAALLAVLVGGVLLLVLVLRLAWIADLLSTPVAAGVMAGVAAHIVVRQLPGLLGLDVPPGPLWATLDAALARVGQANLAGLALGLGVAATVLLAHRAGRRVPGALVALLLAVGAAHLLGQAGHAVALMPPLEVGAVAGGPGWPDPERLQNLLPFAFIVAFLCVVQTALVLRAMPSCEEADIPNALAAVGAGNLAAGLLGAFPVNASPPRSAILAAAGARSQLAGVLTVGLALAALALGGGLLGVLPEAALAGLLVTVGLRLVPWAGFAAIGRASPAELLLALASFALVALLPMQTGVALAIMLSVLHGVAAMLRADSAEFVRVPGTPVWWRAGSVPEGERLEGTVVVGFGAPLNFMTARPMIAMLRAIVLAAQTRPRLVVIEGAGILDMDVTGVRLLTEAVGRLEAQGTQVALARLEAPRAQLAARRMGLLKRLAGGRAFLTVEDAIAALSKSRA